MMPYTAQGWKGFDNDDDDDDDDDDNDIGSRNERCVLKCWVDSADQWNGLFKMLKNNLLKNAEE